MMDDGGFVCAYSANDNHDVGEYDVHDNFYVDRDQEEI